MKPTVLSLTLLAAFLAFPGDARAQQKPSGQDQPKTVGATAPAVSGDETQSQQTPGEVQAAPPGVYLVGKDVKAPIAIRHPTPPYSEEARRAGYAGNVVLSVIVDVQGNVSDVKVEKGLGMGLDEKAVETVRTWKFKPATRDGVPVPVLMAIEISFRLFDHHGSGLGGAGGAPGSVAANNPGGNYVKPTALYRPYPDYTRKARKAKVEGVVAARFTVDSEGNTADIQVTKSLGMGLDEKTVNAVRKWKFEPATRDGVPVPAPMTVAFHFRLEYKTPQEDEQAFAEAGFATEKPALEPNPGGAPEAQTAGATVPQPTPESPGDAQPFGQGAYRVGENVSAPTVISRSTPGYTTEGRRAKRQGTVVLSVVVDPQGNVSEMRVVQGLGYGLNEKAAEAVRAWKFKPGTRDGVPVAVLITVAVAFRLY